MATHRCPGCERGLGAAGECSYDDCGWKPDLEAPEQHAPPRRPPSEPTRSRSEIPRRTTPDPPPEVKLNDRTRKVGKANIAEARRLLEQAAAQETRGREPLRSVPDLPAEDPGAPF